MIGEAAVFGLQTVTTTRVALLDVTHRHTVEGNQQVIPLPLQMWRRHLCQDLAVKGVIIERWQEVNPDRIGHL